MNCKAQHVKYYKKVFNSPRRKERGVTEGRFHGPLCHKQHLTSEVHLLEGEGDRGPAVWGSCWDCWQRKGRLLGPRGHLPCLSYTCPQVQLGRGAQVTPEYS